MARFSVIGSPLQSFMKAGGYRLFPTELPCSLTVKALRDLNKFAPRIVSALGGQVSGCHVTVLVFTYPETLGDSVVKTTCLILDGSPPSDVLIEYCRAADCLVSLVFEEYPRRVVGLGREYLVSTLPPILEAAAKRRLGRSFVGSRVSLLRG